MDILNRIEIKLDALLKCWAVIHGDTEKTLFEIVDELIKQQGSKEKTIEELYEESHKKGDYFESLQRIVNEYFSAGMKPPVDARGFFIDKERIYNIKDIQ